MKISVSNFSLIETNAFNENLIVILIRATAELPPGYLFMAFEL